ncbi:MAG: hypothetical protein V1663_01405 [archaeon]
MDYTNYDFAPELRERAYSDQRRTIRNKILLWVGIPVVLGLATLSGINSYKNNQRFVNSGVQSAYAGIDSAGYLHSVSRDSEALEILGKVERNLNTLDINLAKDTDGGPTPSSKGIRSALKSMDSLKTIIKGSRD